MVVVLLPLLVPSSTASLPSIDPDPTHPSVTQMSVVPHLPTSIAMFQVAHAVDPAALVLVEEMADDQVRAESEEREPEVGVPVLEELVLENVWLEMVDLARLRRNLMPRWRIIGDRRKMGMETVVKLLLLRLLLMETTLT